MDMEVSAQRLCACEKAQALRGSLSAVYASKLYKQVGLGSFWLTWLDLFCYLHAYLKLVQLKRLA